MFFKLKNQVLIYETEIMDDLVMFRFGDNIDYYVKCTQETLQSIWPLVEEFWNENLVVIEIIYPDMSQYRTPDISAFPGGEYYSFEVNPGEFRHFIYNSFAQEKLPLVIRPGYKTPYGASIIITFDYNEKIYAILVKDKTKGYVTNVAGMANIEEENLITAIREIREETGLIVASDQLEECGEFSFIQKKQVLGATLSSGTIIYHVHLNAEQTLLVVDIFNNDLEDDINIMTIENNNEIEKIIVIRPVVLSTEDPVIYDNVKLSTHHAEMISRVFNARGYKDVMTGRNLNRLATFEMNVI